jgi:hypothetical protein
MQTLQFLFGTQSLNAHITNARLVFFNNDSTYVMIGIRYQRRRRRAATDQGTTPA